MITPHATQMPKTRMLAIALVAIIASCSTLSGPHSLGMASAQHVAGKFAARPKVVDKSSSSRKKRAFWKRGGPKVVATEDDDDGEYHAWEIFGSFYESGEDWLNYAWSIMPSLSSEKDIGSDTTIQKAGGAKKNKRGKGKINNGNTIDPSWKWDLFMAESEVFLIAVGISIVLAVLSWIWYNKSSIIPPIHGTKDANAGKKIKEEEEGAEDIICETPEQTHSGFLHSVEVGFEDIAMSLKVKKSKTDRWILDGSIRGKAKPGRMLAIMGPSGSGKTTLLHALAGKVKEDKKINLYGKRYINGEPLTGDSPIPSAFIEQEVNFFPHMTVKETLDFRVELKMGSTLKTKKERDCLVKELMDQLGLAKSANTIVGNAKVRGLSGGERKRLSIACEMISSPPVIFLDEPTSGLDSYQAGQVVETLRKLADQGKTIIAVIHQPSQQTFSLFDDLLLVSEGKLMYFGEVSKVRDHVTDLGYGCEPEVGTAEHVLDCISRVVGTDAEAEKISLERIEKLATAGVELARELVKFDEGETEKKEYKKMKHIVDRTVTHPGTNVFRQFTLLLGRSIHETMRGKAAIIIKVVQQVTLGVIYGGIYHLGDNQASIMDRFGLLSLICIGATNMAMAGTIRSFPKEKAIVSGEMASKMYRTFPYFVAKAVSELPLIGVFNAIFGAIIYPLAKLQKGKFKTFLGLTSLHAIASEAFGLLIGSISPSSDVALALFPPIIVLNIIFDGKNISEENTPPLLRWIPKVGLIRWGFEGLALNEFEGLQFNTSGPRRGPVARTGEEALARFGLEGKSVGAVVGAQTKIIAGCWLLSFLGLALTRQKYEVMNTPLSKSD